MLRSGESRGFAFVRYKYADEAHKAVEKLDSMIVCHFFITLMFILLPVLFMTCDFSMAYATQSLPSKQY